MANEYTVNAADLTAVADAIRAKAGTSEGLSFPGGFAAAIAGISTGAQVASGSVNVSKSSEISIVPGFDVNSLCVGSSGLGSGLYVDRTVVGGGIASVNSLSGTALIKFKRSISGTIYWLATS